MMDDGVEKKVLEEIAHRELMKKDEVIQFLEDKVDNPKNIVNSIINSLVKKELVTFVTPIGESCLVITQKGMRCCNNIL